MARRQRPNEDNKNEERVLYIRRVSKKTTGGNYISFSALVAIGDGEGNVGIGLGRGLEVPPAIQKAISTAKKNMVKLPIFNDTIPHEIKTKYKSARLLLKPAPPGTGLKVGGVVRAVLDIAGVQNASGKIIGTRNQITNAYAVIEAIKKMKARITKEAKTPSVSDAKEEKSVSKVDKAVEIKETVKKEEKKESKKGAVAKEKEAKKEIEKSKSAKVKKEKKPVVATKTKKVSEKK